jgi:methionine-S-sulfoxide reductase
MKAEEQGLRKATFAGGCFWCMEPPFTDVKGVNAVVVGYTGGSRLNPSYEEVCTGVTGHAEAVRVTYDPNKVSYEKLLDIFWRNIDPTARGRQFADVGSQYRTAIFYHDEEQRRIAERSREGLSESGKFGRPVATEIAPAGAFYPAEEYHQHYFRKNAAHYCRYKEASGRAGYIEKTWGGSRHTHQD